MTTRHVTGCASCPFAAEADASVYCTIVDRRVTADGDYGYEYAPRCTGVVPGARWSVHHRVGRRGVGLIAPSPAQGEPKMANKKIELGDVAKDLITGFEGVVVAETKWLHGCVRFSLQPKALKDGKPQESVTFDEPQLKLVSKKAAPTTNATGGPRPEPHRGR